MKQARSVQDLVGKGFYKAFVFVMLCLAIFIVKDAVLHYRNAPVVVTGMYADELSKDPCFQKINYDFS